MHSKLKKNSNIIQIVLLFKPLRKSAKSTYKTYQYLYKIHRNTIETSFPIFKTTNRKVSRAPKPTISYRLSNNNRGATRTFLFFFFLFYFIRLFTTFFTCPLVFLVFGCIFASRFIRFCAKHVWRVYDAVQHRRLYREREGSEV